MWPVMLFFEWHDFYAFTNNRQPRHYVFWSYIWCPSISTYIAWHYICVLSERNSAKLVTNIHRVNGNCWIGLHGWRSNWKCLGNKWMVKIVIFEAFLVNGKCLSWDDITWQIWWWTCKKLWIMLWITVSITVLKGRLECDSMWVGCSESKELVRNDTNISLNVLSRPFPTYIQGQALLKYTARSTSGTLCWYKTWPKYWYRDRNLHTIFQFFWFCEGFCLFVDTWAGFCTGTECQM